MGIGLKELDEDESVWRSVEEYSAKTTPYTTISSPARQEETDRYDAQRVFVGDSWNKEGVLISLETGGSSRAHF